MTTAPDSRDVDRFRAGIARRLGLQFDDARWPLLAEILQRRLEQTRKTAPAYLAAMDLMDQGLGFQQELRELARELTVGETYFFRHVEQFHAMVGEALPQRVAARSAAVPSTRTLNFLSVGCASGEEAYSMAMLLREHWPDPRWTISITGIDINPAALEKAAAAHYSPWALRETPAEVKARWFHLRGRDLSLDPAIRQAVTFREHNLVEDDPTLWKPRTYDVIFCRNVLMYFTPEKIRTVVDRMTRSLAPGGFLFLGHAETLRGLSHDFHLRHTHSTFYYQLRDALEPRDPPPVEVTVAPRHPTPALMDPQWAGTWIETVQRASDRIHALTDNSLATAPLAVPTAGAVRARARLTVRPDLAVITGLMEKEQFSDALELLGELPSESAADPDALLLRAALLTHGGQLPAAEQVCAELLALDELNAGAHYLLALCREGAGDRSGAVEHDQVAVHLDPGFAMPRLHMGLLARRAGQHEVARRELGLALPLLQREDASRLLLFGGGFNRSSLAALCKAELGAAGERS